MKNPAMIRPAVIGIIIIAVLAHYPCVKGINIVSIGKQKAIWSVTGTITVNPQEIPEELRYNRQWFLPYWEEHVNDALAAHKIPVKVLNLELWFESTSETEDVIGFHAEVKIGRAEVLLRVFPR